MSVGDQDGCGVPMPPPVVARGLDQLLDLALGQVLTRASSRLTVTFTRVGALIWSIVFSMLFP